MAQQPPPRHMKIDKRGMLKAFQEREEEDDYEQMEIKKEIGGNGQQHQNSLVQYVTTTSARKPKKQKFYHDITRGGTMNASHHGGGSAAIPTAVPSSINVSTSTGDSQITSYNPDISSTMPALDMSLTEIQADAQKGQIKSCVRNSIFPIWKFYQREFDSQFSLDERTLCGFLLKHTGLKGDEQWWIRMRKVLRKCHTDMRNNAIKNMQTKFKGTHTQSKTRN